MKAPNLVSILVALGALLPALMAAIAQAWPPDTYWWAALIVGLIGAAIKAIQVYVSTQPAPPDANLESFGAAPPAPGKARRFLVG